MFKNLTSTSPRGFKVKDSSNSQRFESLNHAVKEIYNVTSELERGNTLQITSFPVQQLCQQLDMIFFHGLRKAAHGYWDFVNKFTDKNSTKIISNLKSVQSKVGRGRAWLYLTLNERSLESYVCLFYLKPPIIADYYLEHAFLRDVEHLDNFSKLTAGLEHVPFQLEVDSPFLDKSILPVDETTDSQKKSWFPRNVSSWIPNSKIYDGMVLTALSFAECTKDNVQQSATKLKIWDGESKMRDNSNLPLDKTNSVRFVETCTKFIGKLTRSGNFSGDESCDSFELISNYNGPTIPENLLNTRKTFDIHVDNSLLLKLQDAIYLSKKETLHKMFYATVNHSEDKIKLVFIVLTDCCLYIVEQGLCQRNFFIQAVIGYKDLDLLSLGLNNQFIHFSNKWTKKQYIACTGNEDHTKNIVENIKSAYYNKCGSKLVIPNADNTKQNSVLTNWISKKTDTKAEHVKILHYALIHCENVSSCQSSQRQKAPRREGRLRFAFHNRRPADAGNLSPWENGYFVLRHGILYQYSDGDTHELKMYFRMKRPDIRGCCRVKYSSVPHALEFRLAHRKYMRLAAENEGEATRWMQAILETVSYVADLDQETESLHDIVTKVKGHASFGEVMDDNPNTLRSCSLVLTAQTLFLCKETFKTPFAVKDYESLGTLKVNDINTICVDEVEGRYFILKCNNPSANGSTSDWILYFSSADETQNFFYALDEARETILKDRFKIANITDTTLQQACRDRLQSLEKSWKFAYEMLKDPYSVIEDFSSRK